jgi:hypothetical protein
MSEDELKTLVSLAQRARSRDFVACRGELQGHRGVIIYSFLDAASASAFHRKRQAEARSLLLEIWDKTPREVREYYE